jgi:membrane protein CcdC involved in cytochrome C biogenesis
VFFCSCSVKLLKESYSVIFLYNLVNQVCAYSLYVRRGKCFVYILIMISALKIKLKISTCFINKKTGIDSRTQASGKHIIPGSGYGLCHAMNQ